MTIGAKVEPILDVPNGCTRKSNIKIAQDTPMIVEVVMLDDATLIPWIAPSTDWAGVRTPSANVSIEKLSVRARNIMIFRQSQSNKLFRVLETYQP